MDSLPLPHVTAGELDGLAFAVADALDGGDEATAAELTQALEEAAGISASRPAGVLIGRRFARAHRRLLQRLGENPAAPDERAVLRVAPASPLG